MAHAFSKAMEYMGWGIGSDLDDEEAPPGEQEAQVTELHRVDKPVVRETPSVRSTGDVRRIVTVHPTTYNDARTIGEAFRSGTPVIMNLSDMSDADARRVVDFSAGLVFGLHGVIERVTSRVFLLSPATVEVTGNAATSRRGTLFNQS